MYIDIFVLVMNDMCCAGESVLSTVLVRDSGKMTLSLPLMSLCVCVRVHTSLWNLCKVSMAINVIVFGTIQAPSMSADNVMKTLRQLTEDEGYQCAVLKGVTLLCPPTITLADIHSFI